MDFIESNREWIEPPRRNHSWFYIVFAVVVISAVGYFAYSKYSSSPISDNPTSPAPESSNTKTNISDTASANNYFGFNLLRAIGLQKDNVFISPTSLSTAILMAANGAEGQSQTEILSALGLEGVGVEKANIDAAAKMKKFNNSSDKFKISLANSMWTTGSGSFLPNYQSLIENTFLAKASKANSAGEINAWVESKTNGKIKNIINDLSSSFYLVNAIYFKADWTLPFEKSLTAKDSFQANATEVQIDMMRQTDTFAYYEDSSKQIVKLPYESVDAREKYSMIVILPSKDSSAASILEKLDDKTYKQYINNLGQKEVDLKFPKFEINYKDDQVSFLQKLGMSAPFTGTGLTKMTSQPQLINQVIHQSYIKNDELGTEAAAATSIGTLGAAMVDNQPDPVKMYIDHPFIFTIQNDSTAEILFAGVIQNPNSI